MTTSGLCKFAAVITRGYPACVPVVFSMEWKYKEDNYDTYDVITPSRYLGIVTIFSSSKIGIPVLTKLYSLKCLFI